MVQSPPSSLPLQHEISYRDPTFVLTLPFDQVFVKRYVTEAVLHRTKRRWEWFAKAQAVNPSLGTLQYLPTEVRRMIWYEMFWCRETLSSDGLWEYDCNSGSIFDFSAYYFGFGRRGLTGYNGLKGLRLVSSAVQAESNEVFFALRTFRFNHALNLIPFFKQLTPETSAMIASVEIGICLVYWMEPWMHPITQLPPGLREIRFLIFPVDSCWFLSQAGQESLRNLGKLVERAAEATPNARISITSTDREPLPIKCQSAADTIIERLGAQTAHRKRLSSPHLAEGHPSEAKHLTQPDNLQSDFDNFVDMCSA